MDQGHAVVLLAVGDSLVGKEVAKGTAKSARRLEKLPPPNCGDSGRQLRRLPSLSEKRALTTNALPFRHYIR